MIAATIAWDDTLSWSWENAVNALRATLCKVHAFIFCVSDIETDFVETVHFCAAGFFFHCEVSETNSSNFHNNQS